MHLGLPDARHPTSAQQANFYDTLLERVRALPGVDAAGFVTTVPGQGYGTDSTFSIVEHPPLPQGSGLVALSRWADPQYFPSQDPLGKHLRVRGNDAVIVGIVGDTRMACVTPRSDANVENRIG
jgi:hypothetical protein